MPAIHSPISDQVVQDCIVRAIQSVFRTMVGHEVRFVEQTAALVPSAQPASSQIIGSVGFIGDANGLIYLYLDLPFARVCTCHLLGMTEDELTEAGDEVLNDAIGELTNMTVGSFKNGLCDAGYPCKLTIPSIMHGSNFTIEPISSVTRHIYYFDCAGHRIVADLLLKQEDSEPL